MSPGAGTGKRFGKSAEPLLARHENQREKMRISLSKILKVNGVPEGIRTPDLRFRKPLLYPAELPGRGLSTPAPTFGDRRATHYSRKRASRSRAIPVIGCLLASAPAMAQACGGPLAPIGAAAHVRERLEIALEDGRLAAQAGLAPFAQTARDRGRFEIARTALEARLSGVSLAAPVPLPREDRWGRITGHFHTGPDNLGLWLAATGLARVAPAPGDACGHLFLDAEAKARAAKLGLWSDPYYSIIAAENVAALLSRAGEFVLVEGRIARLGQTSARFYLDFGQARGVDLSVTISKQAATALAATGVRPESLPGRRVRVRGLLEHRPGPSIDLTSPLALEMIGR